MHARPATHRRIIFQCLSLGAFAAWALSVGSTRLAAAPRARNVLDTLPQDSSGIISKATLQKHGIASFIGTIQAVAPKERAVIVRAFMISGPRLALAERTLTFYLTANALINRSGTPTSLREIKTGEEASLAVQRAPNGKLMALSLSVGKPRGYPVAQPVPGKPGWVYSPYAPKAGPVDVSVLPRGSEARCPFTQKIFFTPF